MKIVLCEGQDDVAVIEGLAGFAGVEDIVAEHCKGRNNLESYLREMPKRPEFTRGEVDSLMVIIDAEDNAANSWHKIVNAVQLSFQVVLTEPGDFAGTAPKLSGYVISGYVICGQGDKGMIEDLCLQAVSDQPGYSCLQEYFRCLADKTGRSDYLAKARFRAWMASQSAFDLRVGLAAQKGHLPWGNKAFDPLRELLQKL